MMARSAEYDFIIEEGANEKMYNTETDVLVIGDGGAGAMATCKY